MLDTAQSRSIEDKSMIRSRLTPRRLLILACALACGLPASVPASAQVLARPGWAGSGISTDIWWRHAIIYQVDPATFSPSDDATPLHGLAQRLDYIRSLGADALLLTPIQTDATHAQTLNPALGTLEDLDDLIHECSRRNLRVLLDLAPGIPTADLPNVARFWLNRGVAGFHLQGNDDTARAQAAILRKAASSYLGQRILIADAPSITGDTASPPPPETPAAPATSTRSRHHGHAHSRSTNAAAPQKPHALDTAAPQLLLDPRPGTPASLSAAAIRPALDATQGILSAGHSLPLLSTDGPAYVHSMTRYGDGQHDLAIAKVLATVLLATRGDALLFDGQELGVTGDPRKPEPNQPHIDWTPAPVSPAKESASSAPSSAPNPAAQEADPDSLLSWYRQLIAMHHDNPVIANGANITLDHDDQNALVWIRRPASITALNPPIVILCNLSDKPAVMNLKPDIQRHQLRGSFLRTLLRTDGGSGPMHLESIELAPYSVYIGELSY